MGKRSKKTKSRSVNVVRVPFHAFRVDTMTGGALQIQLQPSGWAALNGMYPAFELFKFTRLRYRFQPRLNGSTDSFIVVGYYPDSVQAAVPTTIQLAMDNLDAIIQSDHATVPTAWHSVPASRLKGMISWYKCTADAADPNWESQGLLQFTGAGVEAVYLEVEGICEFRNPVDASVSMARMKDIARKEILDEMKKTVIQTSASSGQLLSVSKLAGTVMPGM